MDPQHWRQIEELYSAALACEPSERSRLLEQVGPEVRREVELMLAQSGSLLLDRPVWEALPEDSGTTLAAGHRLGRYEIEAPLGAGGMGEVFRARDTRLNRTVALKISKTQFSERFEREARAIAALNHPNICQLYDIGHHGGVDFLVMEYLEGETLFSRLKKGAPPEQMLEYSIQIADALDKAHRKGLTHRDLKPGNIMLTKSGAKLLDFGLAKWKHGAAASPAPLSQLFTETDPITARGTIVGTLPYMAPEQLEGKEADARTDIFAFGAVLYEMATGRKAFQSGSQASLIAKIMHSDPPPIRSFEPLTPVSLDRLVKACLAKDPEERIQSARDVKLELEWIRDAAGEPAQPARAGALSGWRRALPWGLFGATALGLVVLLSLHEAGSRNTNDADPARFEIPLPAEPELHLTASLALSPDGRKLAFAAVGSDGTPQIWVRDFDSLQMHPLAGTASAGSLLIWAPDSQSVAFDSDGKLQTVDISGSSVKTLCDLDRLVFSGSWSKYGVILFAGFGGPVMRVSADGGIPAPVTALDTAHGDVAHTNPQFLPDGRHFLYLRDLDTSGAISVGSLDTKPGEQDPRRLIEGVTGPAYASSPGRDSGELLFLRGRTLMAQRFDAGRLTLLGNQVAVVNEPVQKFFDTGIYSVANNGTLAYRTQGSPESQLTWFDEKGKSLTRVGPVAIYRSLALSPDGTQALVTKQEASGYGSVWLIDTSRGTSTPLANVPRAGYSQSVVWRQPGRGMIFGMARSGQMADLYEKPIDVAGDGQELFHSGKYKIPLSLSPDGFLLFNVYGKGLELWALPLKQPAKAAPLLQGGPNYLDAQFSPDGHWVAYESNESNRFDVYVRSFSEGHLGNGVLVSPDGGHDPRWSKDGKQLYYLGLDNKLMTTKVTLGTTAQAGVPTALFQAPRNPHLFPDWAPSPDGKRFLFLAPQQQQDTPITVVLNWQTGLKK